ncbi:MAG TPA: hypothetical protein VKX96_09855 [Chloroflexota bacterium]|nr:hypothetical protein [Chloroflexota bacterium]
MHCLHILKHDYQQSSIRRFDPPRKGLGQIAPERFEMKRSGQRRFLLRGGQFKPGAGTVRVRDLTELVAKAFQ